MRWTPFKQGRAEGQRALTNSYSKYRGRKRNDYVSGLSVGLKQRLIALINKEADSVNAVTDIGD